VCIIKTAFFGSAIALLGSPIKMSYATYVFDYGALRSSFNQGFL